MNAQDIRNPDLSYQALTEAGVTRSKFTVLYGTPIEMIKAFASRLLDDSTIKQLSSRSSMHRRENLANTYLYVYTSKAYKMFLQMISLENIFSNGCMTYTDNYELLFSEQADAGFDGCPIFSQDDEKSFDLIEVTPYGQKFDSKSIHLVRLHTVDNSFGGMHSDITEYNLYIPTG